MRGGVGAAPAHPRPQHAGVACEPLRERHRHDRHDDHHQHHHVDLRQLLAEAESRELLTASQADRLAPAVADRLVETSAGNPLALLEIPRLLSDGQRAYDLDILVENVAFGLADLGAMQGRDDASDALDRRVEFKVVGC